jgi:hypothetical protein
VPAPAPNQALEPTPNSLRPSLAPVIGRGSCLALCWAKEKAILELLATGENELDAVVQCGTNMSLIDVAEKLGPVTGIPIWESIR